MSRAWMPLYVADYLADTGHLTTAEHGAYLLLIMHYWSNGGLPDDERKLARIARMTPNEWADAGITLKGFFSDGWRHKRIDAEFERAAEKSSKAASSANKRWMRTHSEGICERNANAMLPQSQSQSQLSSNEDNKTREARPLAVRAAFDAFWRRWPHKVGKPAAEKAFTKVSGEIEAILAGIDRYVRDKPPDRPWLNPATFLNQRRWEDAPAGISSMPAPNGRGGMASLLAKSLGLKNGRESRDTDEAVHVLPVHNRVERGNVGDDGSQLSGDVIDLLAFDTVRGL